MKKKILLPGVLIACVLIISPLIGYSQKKDKDKFKYGNITVEELTNPAQEDSTAGAVVLFDVGKSYFMETANTVQIVFERHKRIKINSKSGYDWGNANIGLRIDGGDRESISNFSAATYNLVGGKIIATKLEKDGIFDDKVIESYSYKKFAMPDVKEGSIIEYKYKIYSPFIFNIRDWTYQDFIPVRYSEYIFEVPDFFNFKKEMRGYDVISTQLKTESRSFLGYPSNLQIYTTYAQNLSAFKSEAYLTCADNFRTKMEFEIASVSPPWGVVINLLGGWPKIEKLIAEDESFGGILKKTNAVKDKVDSLIANKKTDKEKMIAIYDYVRMNFRWNEENSLTASQKIKKTLESKSGNSGDINLLLTLMLKTAGLATHPVILSTRDNGMIVTFYAPILSKYNYSVARVMVDGKSYLLDATDKWRGYDVLPERCMNGSGRILYETGSDWVDLKNKESYLDYSVMQLKLDNDGNLSGTINSSKKSYAAFIARSQAGKSNHSDYVNEVKKRKENWDINKIEIENLDKLEETFIEKYDLKISNMTSLAGDKFYLEPVMLGKIIENPFKMDQRKYPVDFAYPINQVYNCSIKLPEGYTLEEKVKPVLATLPDKAGRFSFEVTEVNGELSIKSSFSISKVTFLPDEYEGLKQFYNFIINKHAEQIVLKKQ